MTKCDTVDDQKMSRFVDRFNVDQLKRTSCKALVPKVMFKNFKIIMLLGISIIEV